jgi:hypothetical protein
MKPGDRDDNMDRRLAPAVIVALILAAAVKLVFEPQ